MEQIKFVEDSQVMSTIKLVSIGNFKQLEVSNKADYVTNKAACIL